MIESSISLPTIAVTGACGMLGRPLVKRLLHDGYGVIAIDIADDVVALSESLHGNADHPRLTSIKADVRDASAMRGAITGAESVVHAAAALPSYSASDIADVDVRGTETVLASAIDVGVSRVVHVSSTAVYGLPQQIPTPEDAPFGPVDSYSRAKINAELACRVARSNGLVVPVLRPKTFLGPQRLGLFAMLFQWADEGHGFPLLDGGEHRCQMLDVEDLVDAVMAALTGASERVNTDFNIAADDFGNLADDFQAVLDAAGYGQRVRSIRSGLALPALRLLAALGASPVYDRLLHKLCQDSFVDTDRARLVLGVEPRWSNRATILRTYRWWRENQEIIGCAAPGRTHTSPWRQGALRFAKAAF